MKDSLNSYRFEHLFRFDFRQKCPSSIGGRRSFLKPSARPAQVPGEQISEISDGGIFPPVPKSLRGAAGSGIRLRLPRAISVLLGLKSAPPSIRFRNLRRRGSTPAFRRLSVGLSPNRLHLDGSSSNPPVRKALSKAYRAFHQTSLRLQVPVASSLSRMRQRRGGRHMYRSRNGNLPCLRSKTAAPQ